MRTPNHAAPRCAAPVAAGCDMYAAIDVIVAANPTKEWKAATSCGKSVMAHLAAIIKPIEPPAPNATAAWVSKPPDAVASRGPAVAAKPSKTPAPPNALPVRAVACDDSMEMAPTLQTKHDVSILIAHIHKDTNRLTSTGTKRERRSRAAPPRRRPRPLAGCKTP